MTREEAMEALSVLKIYDAQWLREAVDMAIEALEQEETLQNLTKPNKSDLISRQAAIDAVKEAYENDEMFDGYEYRLQELPSAQPFTEDQIQTMQELESAQVEKAYELGKADRPTGHWIYDVEAYPCGNPYGHYDCDQCGESVPYKTNFCPNCGADMRGGEEE